jgi:hypothetical protein
MAEKWKAAQKMRAAAERDLRGGHKRMGRW